MKVTHVYAALMVLAMWLVPSLAWAGSPAPAAPLTAKQEAKVSRLMEKLERRMERKMVKSSAEANQPREALDPHLKKAIIYALIGTVVQALWIVPVVGWIAGIVGLIFYVLAVLELLKWIETL